MNEDDAVKAHNAYHSTNLVQRPDLEITEETAVTLCVLINNHITTLRIWERKLKGPFLPTTVAHYRLTPHYPRPTIATVLHILHTMKHGELEVLRVSLAALQALKKERDA